MHQASLKLNFYDANLKLSLSSAYSSELEIDRYFKEEANTKIENLMVDNQHYYTIAGDYLYKLTIQLWEQKILNIALHLERMTLALSMEGGEIKVYEVK